MPSRISAVIYPAATPIRMGISLNQPLPNRDVIIVVRSATPATIMAVFSGTSQADPSPVRPMAIWTATGASTRPITMITGPTTTGGNRRCRKPAPKALIQRLKTSYSRPAATKPHMVEGMPHVCTP